MHAALALVPLLLAAVPAPDALSTLEAFHATEAARLERRVRFLAAAPVDTASYDVEHYDLRIRLVDPLGEGFAIEGTAAIRLRLTARIQDVRLDLHGFDVREVRANGAPASHFREPAGAPESLIVRLPRMTDAGTVVTVELAWAGVPETDAEGPFVTGLQRSLALGQVFTHSEPDFAHWWFPCHDHPADKATLRLAVTGPRDWLVAGNGVLVDETYGEEESTFTWATDLPISTYLVAFAAGPFERVTATHGDLPLVHYLHPTATLDRHGFDRVPEMLDVFEATFGPYPFEKYGHALVEMPGGMENQTITFLHPVIADAGNPDAQAIIAHELAHHWWGDLVTLAAWEDIWLNEGFASYAEALWVEATEGEAAYRDRLFTFGQLGIAFDEEGGHRSPLYDPAVLFGFVVYKKGARILGLLRDHLGDEAFFAGLREYARTHGFGNASTEDFRAAMEAASGQDLRRFFHDWVYAAGYPEVLGAYRIGGRALELDLEQLQRNAPIYELPVEVLLRLDDGTERIEPVLVDEIAERIRLCLPAGVRQVELDPGRKVFWKLLGFERDFAPADESGCEVDEPGTGGAGGSGGDAGGGGGTGGAGGIGDGPGGSGGTPGGGDPDEGGGADRGGCGCGAGGPDLSLLGVGVAALALRRRR